MIIGYMRDLEHNYMRIEPQEETAQQYALKMLEAQPVEGTLPFEVRQTDGVTALYYRIDGLLSLYNYTLVQRIDAAALKGLFRSLCFATERLKEYLLDEESLLLHPETVFYDETKREWLFCCYPYTGGKDTAEDFAERLAQDVDSADEEAKAVLALAAKSMRCPGLRASDLFPEAHAGEQSAPCPAREGTLYGELYAMPEGDARGETVYETRQRERRKRKTVKEKKGPEPRLMCLLFVLVVLAVIYIRKNYLLEGIASVVSLVVLATGVAGAAGCLVMQKKDAFLHRDRGRKRHKKNGSRTVRHTQERVQVASCAAPKEDAEEEAYTTLLAPPPFARRAKLYSRDESYNRHIALDLLPLTIGKSSGADVSINESSVSRSHAHIRKDASGRITVRDLNSTNGTWRNGIRLHPNEEIALQIGDELRFGNLTFEYV